MVPLPGAEGIVEAAAASSARSSSMRRPRRGRLSARRGDAAPVVGDLEGHLAVVAVDRDRDVAGVRVVGDVPQRLLRRAEEQRLVRGGQLEARLDGELRGDAPCVQPGEQVGQRALQSLAVQPLRVEIQQQRAELADRPADLVPRPADRLAVGGRPIAGRRAEAVGDGGQVLHDAVVQLARDAAALVLAGRDGLVQQGLAALLAAAQAPRQRAGERDLREVSSTSAPSSTGATSRHTRWPLAAIELSRRYSSNSSGRPWAR